MEACLRIETYLALYLEYQAVDQILAWMRVEFPGRPEFVEANV
jgi:hypothetical protein